MKNVVITGSTRGIGFCMAIEFLRAGSNVTLSGRGGALPDEVRKSLSPFVKNYIYVPCNVQEKAALQNLWELSLAKWDEIDIWINNAGQNMPHEVSWKIDEPCVDNILQTNLLGMIYGS